MTAEMNLSPYFIEQLKTLPKPTVYVVAFSGGLDSHVLLHLMCALRDQGLLQAPLRAIHIDHQLQAQSDQWAQHCLQIATQLNITCDCLSVNVQCIENESLESGARRARYAAMGQHLPEQAMLLCAHHQQDQAETVLLRLLRGAGVKGLSAMSPCKSWEKGWLARPLLTIAKSMLVQYANDNCLDYLQDPSNTDTSHSRNYLRHQVLPKLVARWPQAVRQLASSANLCANSDSLLTEWAEQQLPDYAGHTANTLSVSKLLSITRNKCDILLRTWLATQTIQMPSRTKLQHIYTDVLQAKWEASPCITFSGIEIRRYRDDLYVLRPQPNVDCQTVLLWQVETPLDLPNRLGSLVATKHRGQGICLSAIQACAGINVRFRHGRDGMRIKKLFQRHGVVPWERDRVPLLYLSEQLAGVLDWWTNPTFAADDMQWGVVCHWEK